ncbi:hypothetical protein RFI_15333 [Reticulomyxa filosa]|uniref:Bet v I/Major latex protein domain-containing protein n=1 Tax=Reticulomyxa filosa TaxID=46433 RepID=X6N6J5_RETFI|nr:hypothetical protein RFI_15333 [Reticulomyxa filosa]|eukprot:ETO21870.1 hypothetical protein RFI_15333 [Reticulomyxa filosa]
MSEEKEKDIPSSTHVSESTVLNANIDKVWELVHDCTFPFSGLVKQVKKDSSGGPCKSLFVFCYKLLKSKGTSQTIQIVELSELKHFVTYSIVMSEPRFVFFTIFLIFEKKSSLLCVFSVKYSSATHTIKLFPVTVPVGGAEAQTFIQWETDFSNDAKIDVIEDSRFKKREAFSDLAKALKGGHHEKTSK